MGERCKKVCFADEKSAIAYIDKLNKTSVRAVKPVRSYLCPKCFTWHLTSIESRENMLLVYKDREISNLKRKVEHLKNEVEILKKKLN